MKMVLASGAGGLTMGVDPNGSFATGTGWGGSSFVTILGAAAAAANGTLTSFKVKNDSAGSFSILVGSLSGGNFTVRNASGLFTSPGAGVNTYTAPGGFNVLAGDLIGLWLPPSGTPPTTLSYRNSAETMYYVPTVVSAPAPGTVYTGVTSYGGAIPLQGLGA